MAYYLCITDGCAKVFVDYSHHGPHRLVERAEILLSALSHTSAARVTVEEYAPPKRKGVVYERHNVIADAGHRAHHPLGSPHPLAVIPYRSIREQVADVSHRDEHETTKGK